MRITGLYAAIAALFVVIVGFRVTLRRRAIKVGIGNGGDSILAQRIRVHANAVEYLPIALILLLILELNQTEPLLLHVFGVLLLLGRVLHAWGLSMSPGVTPGRGFGMVLTWGTIAAMAVLLIWQALVLWVLT
jgi:uncharacterized membrane protein YecN with MAPEG domain